ncbi:MAG: GFA family protein [Gammaproteobacteria bacterium]|nr:GFA family protein [Gammaproteobacteria bacterium]MBU1414630.1 GFA family protein [Gammaproteobacteria bacterium]
MHKGSCLCGQVQYEIDESLGPIVFCHCSVCRKSTGSAHQAVTRIPSAAFRITRGQDVLREYRHEPAHHRYFCGNCGSGIYARRDSKPEMVIVRLGTVDTPVDQEIAAHIFVDSKASWDHIPDDAPKFPEWPPSS